MLTNVLSCLFTVTKNQRSPLSVQRLTSTMFLELVASLRSLGSRAFSHFAVEAGNHIYLVGHLHKGRRVQQRQSPIKCAEHVFERLSAPH